MKNLSILTYHFADNYGAVLQAWALSEYCSKLGMNTSILNYVSLKMMPLKRRIRKILKPSKIEEGFSNFRKKFLNISSKKGDLILIGSDQVWNPGLNYYDEKYFNPGKFKDGIYSYAASVGNLDSKESRDLKYFENLKGSLKNFSGISVREESTLNYLKDTFPKTVLTCDPVLLFYEDSSVFEKICNESKLETKNKKYILVYSLEPSEDLDKMIKSVKEKTGLEVYAIHPGNKNLQKGVDHFIPNADPSDFLKLIRDSSYIITNSYHGLLFSFIFKKKVICVPHSKTSSRQIDFLKKADFSMNKYEESFYIDTDQEYSESLKKYIRDSQDFLRKLKNFD